MTDPSYRHSVQYTNQPGNPGVYSVPVETPHPLSIKLMRLNKPEFSLDVPVLTERRDTLGDHKIFVKTPNYASDVSSIYGQDLSNSHHQQPNFKEEKLIEIPGISDSGLQTTSNISQYITDRCLIPDSLGFNDSWSLPSAPGAIYVGETLKCYISLHNESYNNIRNITVTAELYTGKGKATKQTLLDINATPIDVLASKSNKDFIIEQPLSSSDDINDDEDKTCLVCNVSYYDPEEGRLRSFRKLFPFKVYNPLGMKVKVYTFGTHIFVQLDLQNLTQAPSLFVDLVKFDPNFGLDLVDHSTHNTGDRFYEYPLLRGESKRLLFELIPNLKHSKTATALGKISLQWKNTMGECGMLITNSIQHKGVSKQDLEAAITGFTNTVPEDDLITGKKPNNSEFYTNQKFELHKPFYAICEVSNYSKENMDLSLHLEPDKLYPLGIHGSSMQNIGELEPTKVKTIYIPLFPLQRGVHSVAGKGILLKDKKTGKVVTLPSKPILID